MMDLQIKLWRLQKRMQRDIRIPIVYIVGRNISAKNALNTVEKLNDRIQTVIDNVDSSIYVIDKYNFNILYYNDSFAKKIGEIPDSKRPCYELIHGNNAPCDFCPLAELEGSQENQNISMVMNNFGIYKETVDVIASEMQWENAQAYIINISEHLESPEEAERRKQQEHIEKKYAFVYSHSCETIIDINVEKGNVHYTVIKHLTMLNIFPRKQNCRSDNGADFL